MPKLNENTYGQNVLSFYSPSIIYNEAYVNLRVKRQKLSRRCRMGKAPKAFTRLKTFRKLRDIAQLKFVSSKYKSTEECSQFVNDLFEKCDEKEVTELCVCAKGRKILHIGSQWFYTAEEVEVFYMKDKADMEFGSGGLKSDVYYGNECRDGAKSPDGEMNLLKQESVNFRPNDETTMETDDGESSMPNFDSNSTVANNDEASCDAPPSCNSSEKGETLRHIPITCGICLMKFTSFDELVAHHNSNPHANQFFQDDATTNIEKAVDSNLYLGRTGTVLKPTVSKPTSSVLANKNNTYHCTKCDASFPTLVKLDVHEKQHLGKDEKPEICDECGMRFGTKSSLTSHKITHSGPEARVFTCLKCGNSFKRRSYLALHMKTIHANEAEVRIYACKYCDKKFKFPQKVKTHEQLHLGEEGKKFECDVCGKRFVRNDNLIAHRRIHMGDEGKIFSCEVCGQRFNQRAPMNTHRKALHGIKTNQAIPLK